MKIYGIYDKIMEDYVMVSLAPNDKTIVRGLRCPENCNPDDYEIHCFGSPDVDHSLGSMSQFVELNEQGGISPDKLRNLEGK